MNLVDDWKNAYKWFSMHCMVLSASIQGSWCYIPDDMRQSIPQGVVTAITIGLLVIGIFGRLIQQKKKKC